MFGDFKNGNGHYDTDAGGVVGNFKVSRSWAAAAKENIIKAPDKTFNTNFFIYLLFQYLMPH